MLKKTPDELSSADGHALGFGCSGGPISEGHLAIVDREDSAVGDGHTVNVAGEVLQDFAGALDSRFTVNDPILLPEAFRQVKC